MPLYPDPLSGPLQLATAGPGRTKEIQFTAIASAPPGQTMVIDFVAFGVPADSGTVPALPQVWLQRDAAGVTYDVTPLPLNSVQNVPTGDVNKVVGVLLRQHTDSTLAAAGVYQLLFFPEGTYNLNGEIWKVQFQNQDSNPVQVTISVDSTDVPLPWISVPFFGATDFAAAATLTPLALEGTPPRPPLPVVSPEKLVCGETYDLDIPVYNYGTKPLVITIAADVVAGDGTTGIFTLKKLVTTETPNTQLTIPPGGGSKLAVTFAAPGTPGLVFTQAAPATLAIPSNDATTGHTSSLSFYTTVGTFEFAFVLDNSGSMDTVDPVTPPKLPGQTRWIELRDGAQQILTHMKNFAEATARFGAVAYPGANGELATIVKASEVITASSTLDLTALAPHNGTPMADGMYKAIGPNDPTIQDQNCGILFSNDGDPVHAKNYKFNHRFMILMTDGAHNVGDDPNSLDHSYYGENGGKNVQAITVAYGSAAGGQFDPGTVQTIASTSGGHYFQADPQTAEPAAGLGPAFVKAVTTGLGLTFATDPSAVLPYGTIENRHAITITEFDTKFAFYVNTITQQEGAILHVELITPLGERVTPDNASSFGFRYTEGLLFKTYFIDNTVHTSPKSSPRPGVWTLVVSRAEPSSPPILEITLTRASISTGGGLRYAYQTVVDSELTFRAGIAAGAQVYAGDPISVGVALAVKGHPVRNAQVSAQMAGNGPGFDNWLAAQTVTDAEYQAALKALGGLTDIQGQFVKTRALAAKGIVFPGTGTASILSLQQDPRSGAYKTTFTGTTLPGTYQFLITAVGQDAQGNSFQRQAVEQISIGVLPDAASTIVQLTYQLVNNQIQATLKFWPRDRFGNVFLTDPTISKVIQVLLQGGAVASGPLTGNLDGSYIQIFTFPVGSTPTVSINIGGNEIVPPFPVPDFNKLTFVNEVVQYHQGRESQPGANIHRDPSLALGDPSRKPATSFVSLGGLGSGAFDVKGKVLHPKSLTVFVAPDDSLRAYAVDVLPGAHCTDWVEIGKSVGVTQTFNLVPSPGCGGGKKGSFVNVEGKVAGESFDVHVSLDGQLHSTPDPLRDIALKGIAQVRVRDLSNVVLKKDRTPSASPGVSVAGIGFTS